MEKIIFTILLILFLAISCEKEQINKRELQYNTQNITLPKNDYQEINNNQNFKYTSEELHSKYLANSSDYQIYNVDESIQQLEEESKALYEKQKKEIEEMKKGFSDLNSSYNTYQNERQLEQIKAEARRIQDDMERIKMFTVPETPYIPDPIRLPSIDYSNDYINPNANPNKIDISGYTKSNGTYVEPHIRTAPNNTTKDNLRYPY